jgi:hypothetical protein
MQLDLLAQLFLGMRMQMRLPAAVPGRRLRGVEELHQLEMERIPH